MNTYVWIMLVLLCALAIPVIWTSVNRCQKCHGFCEDEEACQLKQNLNNSIARYEQTLTTKEINEQKENDNSAA